MDNLLKEVTKLTEQEIIPKKCLSYILTKHFFYKTKKIDSERVLENLNALSTNEIFSIFTNPKIVNHQTFYTFLLGIVRKYLNTTPKKLIEMNFGSNGLSRALIIAAKAGNKEAVQLLLQHGANDSINNQSPALQYAYFHGHSAICQLLLQHGMNLNFNNREGDIALRNAALSGMEKRVQFLLEHRANPNAIHCVNDESVLMIAADLGKTEVVRLLLEHGANPNYVTPRRATSVLTTAVNITSGKTEVVRLLLDRGANPNHRDREGNTPLILALNKTQYYQSVNKEVIRLLLDRGANPNVINDEGTSALTLALDDGNKEVIRLLSEYGAFGYLRQKT